MKIAILSFNKRRSLSARKGSNNEKLLIDAAKKRGHQITLIRAEKCQIYCGRRELKTLYNSKPFPKFDIIIPKVSITNSEVPLECSILKQLQLSGYLMLNKYQAIVNAKNKLRTMQVLVKHNLPVPKTIVVRRFEFLDDAIKKVGGTPVVLKLPHGSWGIGVAIVESNRSLHSALDIFWKSREHNFMMIQEYIKESEGKDIRVYVAGGKIIASMVRSAKEGDFRSNLSIGGVGEPVELTMDEQKIALKATKAMNLQIAGVDLIRSHSGPLVIEVNSNPGLSGITEVTGTDVGGEIIKYAELYVKRHKAMAKGKKEKIKKM